MGDYRYTLTAGHFDLLASLLGSWGCVDRGGLISVSSLHNSTAVVPVMRQLICTIYGGHAFRGGICLSVKIGSMIGCQVALFSRYESMAYVVCICGILGGIYCHDIHLTYRHFSVLHNICVA